MSLDSFRNKFLNLCKTENIIPHDSIIESIKNSFFNSQSKGFSLTLSEKNLTNDMCKILSECFRHDNTFESISFNDCMISSDCLQLIVEGLCDNSFCRTISLKGNNIKNTGCELLARLLRQNSSLNSLSLEWNQVGVSSTGFDQFCHSLASNCCLETLDLRNNQIGFDNCQQMVQALSHNECLRSLDVRYNSLGVSGGKELLKIFDKNRSLTKVQVLGNNIPSDIMYNIENLAKRNEEILKSSSKSPVKSEKMNISFNGENHSRNQSFDLVDKIDQQSYKLRMSDKKSLSKIIQLEKFLDERKQKCNQLNASLKLAESKLEMYETQFKEMETHFQKSLKEREYLERQFNLQNDKEKDFRIEMEKRFLKEQSSLQERILQLQNKVGELEVNLKQQNDNTFELKEKITTANSDSKMKQLEYEEQIAKMKDLHKKEISDVISQKEKDLQKMRHECNSNEDAWKEKLSKNEKSQEDLYQELSRLKNQISSDKMAHEGVLHETKQKLRAEESHKTGKLEEQLRALQTIKEELESQNTRQSREIENLQKDNSKLKIELESLKIRKENLEEELSGKHSEMISEIEKNRLEWMHRVQKLETERQSQADLFTKIEQQDKQIQDMRNSFREELNSRNAEIQTLKDKIKCQEMEINRSREDEKIRASALQSAVMQYCQPSLHSNYNSK